MWHSKITVSLNILYYGYRPERPLALYIEDAGNAPIDSQFIPPFSQKPVAIVNGCVLKCMLAEIKADWKFHKEPRKHCNSRNVNYVMQHDQTRHFDFEGAIQFQEWMEQHWDMPPLLCTKVGLPEVSFTFAYPTSTGLGELFGVETRWSQQIGCIWSNHGQLAFNS